MIDRLLVLSKNAYVPISNFKVASIVTTKDGHDFYGVNVEDASTRAGSCAERTAIFSAVTAGYKKGDFKEINVCCADDDKIGTPCFVCRQMINELFDRDSIVRCFSKTGEYKEYTVAELCPHPFDENDLN